jgi:hypothetical protein
LGAEDLEESGREENGEGFADLLREEVDAMRSMGRGERLLESLVGEFEVGVDGGVRAEANTSNWRERYVSEFIANRHDQARPSFETANRKK